MSIPRDTQWIVDAAGAAGLGPSVGREGGDVVVRAAGRSEPGQWGLEARIVNNDGAIDKLVRFDAPRLACPPVAPEVLLSDDVPRVQVSVTDRSGAASELGGYLTLATELVRALRRRPLSPPPMPTFLVPPGPALAPGLRDRFAVWPRPAPPPLLLSASPWQHLSFVARYWNEPASFQHQLALWRDTLADLVAAGAVVDREPASLTPPSGADLGAATDALMRRLRGQ